MTQVPPDLLELWSEAMTRPILIPSLDDPPPDWVDKDRYRRGRLFMRKHAIFFGLAILMGSSSTFVQKGVFNVFLISQKFTRKCLQRIMETAMTNIHWMTDDLWDPQGVSYKEMVKNQTIHKRVRVMAIKQGDKLGQLVPDVSVEPDVYEECVLWDKIRDDFRSCPSVQFSPPSDQVCMNQFDMLSVVLGSMIGMVMYPEKLGLHGVSRQDMEDFLHCWRVLFFYIGVEDRFNPCSLELDKFKQHVVHYIQTFAIPSLQVMTKEDEYVPRLHLKCLVRLVPAMSLVPANALVLYGFWTLGVDMPTTTRSVGRYNKMVFWMLRFFMTVVMRVSFVRFIVVHIAEYVLVRSYRKYCSGQSKSLK